MADFNILGDVGARARDFLRTFSRMEDAVEETADSLHSASAAAGEFSSSAAAAIGPVEAYADRVDNLSDQLNEVTASATGASGALTGMTLSQQIQGGMADPFISDPEVREETRRRLRLSEQQMGGILGNFRRGRIQSIDEYTRALDRASDDTIQLSSVSKVLEEVLEDVRGVNYQVAASSRVSASSMDEMGDEARTSSVWIRQLARAQNKLARANLKEAVTGLWESFLDLGDETEGAVNSFRALSPELSNLSLNIGPFNLALKNIITTLPLLVSLMSILIGVVSALATAFFTAGIAIGSFMALGIFDLLENLEQNFAGITETGEAMTAIFEGLQAAVSEAVAPLRQIEFAGLSPLQLFLGVVQDVVFWIHLVSEAFAEILQMPVVEDFFFRIRNAMLGLGESEGPSMMDALREAIRSILPYVTDFFTWFIDALPDFILWATEISERVLPALKEFGREFIIFSRELGLLGAEVLPGVLHALGDFLLHVANMTKWIRENIPYLEELAYVLTTVALALVVLPLSTVATILAKIVAIVGVLNTVLGALATGALALTAWRTEELVGFWMDWQNVLEDVLVDLGLTETQAAALVEVLKDSMTILAGVDRYVRFVNLLNEAFKKLNKTLKDLEKRDFLDLARAAGRAVGGPTGARLGAEVANRTVPQDPTPNNSLNNNQYNIAVELGRTATNPSSAPASVGRIIARQIAREINRTNGV